MKTPSIDSVTTRLRPVGTVENSPTFHRWVGQGEVIRPEGTTEISSVTRLVSRPFGTGSRLVPVPNTEVLGYSQKSLRDWARFIACLSLTGAILAGCAVGPNYHPPPTKAPTHWNESPAGGETNSSIATTEWWTKFNDFELDSLVGRAVRSNLDVRIAQARVREARAQYGIAAANLWPTVDGSSSYARQRQSEHQPVLGAFPLPSNVFENNVYQAGFDASGKLTCSAANVAPRKLPERKCRPPNLAGATC